MSIPTLTVTPSTAADAYARTDRGDGATGEGSFGTVLQRAVQGAVDAGHKPTSRPRRH